ncbi:hypothetical protein A0H81_07739 [Grifola frondosa]|uniref:Uncharacterized protein n=1 Tax=Grifola frondosa TaxID=5627 RepID=A0A1C7M7G5_GRIFR|nr:hypothetical protein A0H81_07739 [Grifola frondosa]
MCRIAASGPVLPTFNDFFDEFDSNNVIESINVILGHTAEINEHSDMRLLADDENMQEDAEAASKPGVTTDKGSSWSSLLTWLVDNYKDVCEKLWKEM